MAKRQVKPEEIKTLCEQCGKWFRSPEGYVKLNETLQRACEARMSGDKRAAFRALINAQDEISDLFIENKNELASTEEGREWVIDQYKKGKA